MKRYLLIWLTALALTAVTGAATVPLLRKIKFGQPILKYVKAHESKNGTPTMGGLFFILSAVITFFCFNGQAGRIAVTVTAIGVFYMLVGFLDDFIKIKYRRNEGLKPYQKIVFQTAIAFLAGAYAYMNGLSLMLLPFTRKAVDVGLWIVPIVAFIYIAFTNSVNLTDGIDGLSASVSAVYLAVTVCLIILGSPYSSLWQSAEYDAVLILAFALLGSFVGFLIFNTNKASVFMGDTGSLAIGGFLSGISVFTGNALYIPIVGVTFVWSALSVMIQVLYYKKTKKRVFLMAPYHHHLQMKGVVEGKICFYYCLITVIIGALTLITYI